MKKRLLIRWFWVLLSLSCIIRLYHALKVRSSSSASSIALKSCNSSTRSFSAINNTGVILFYHIAKTGGTTIRRNIAQLENVTYVLAKQRVDKQIEQVLTGKTKRILFVEWHGVSPSLVQLPIKRWRQLSRQYQIPLFAFTLLRDPVALHVSAHSFFHHSCPTCSLEEELISTAIPNRQCLVLARGQGNRHARRTLVTAKECRKVYNLLCNDWDWVGTTEDLDRTTFPLLMKMIAGNASVVPTRANVGATPGNLSFDTRQALKAMSQFDFELYETFRGQTTTMEGID